MDALSFQQKAALCLRLARGLLWNNPGRLQLTDLAERFERQAKELELFTKDEARWIAANIANTPTAMA